MKKFIFCFFISFLLGVVWFRYSNFRDFQVLSLVHSDGTEAKPLFRVQDEILSSQDVDTIVASYHLDLGNDGVLRTLKENIILQLLEQKILIHYIKQKGRAYEDVIQFISVEKNQHLADQTLTDQQKKIIQSHKNEKQIIQSFLDARAKEEIKVSPAEIQAYYDSNKDQFSLDSSVVLRQIVTATEDDAKRVQAGITRQNFVERAREFSITPEASNGGLLGPITRKDLPEIFDIAIRMRTGSIHGIYKSTYGFHLFYLIKKDRSRLLSLSEVKDQIHRVLFEEKKQQIYKETLEAAMQHVNYQII